MKLADFVVIIALLPTIAIAADYSNDDLCRAIGETAKVSVQPRDRLFFEKTCVCYAGFPCMEKGTPKARSAAEIVEKAEKRQRAEAAAREDAKRKAADADKARRAERAKARAAAEKRATETCRAEKDAWDTCFHDMSRNECGQELRARADLTEVRGMGHEAIWFRV
ncbi:MAG: hypothetical protein WCC48_12260 [Anaeromyxobacteraceae bacterium]